MNRKFRKLNSLKTKHDIYEESFKVIEEMIKIDPFGEVTGDRIYCRFCFGMIRTVFKPHTPDHAIHKKKCIWVKAKELIGQMKKLAND